LCVDQFIENEKQAKRAPPVPIPQAGIATPKATKALAASMIAARAPDASTSIPSARVIPTRATNGDRSRRPNG
jgi:hypothetical protein